MEQNALIKDTKSSFSYSCSSMIRSKCSSNSCSPYQRITSKTNLASSLLPAFIKPNTPQHPPASLPLPKSPKKPESDSEIISFIVSAKSPLDTLIKVGKYDLNQSDLKSLSSSPISQKLIFSILTIAKYLNSKVAKEKQGVKKVLIAKNNFTKKVFSNERPGSKANYLSTGILICPIYIGHWTVLTFDSSDMVVNFYDPMKNPAYLKQILKNFYDFLRRQTKNQPLNRSLKSLVYQKVVINEDYTEQETDVFMLQVVVNLALGNSFNVQKAEFDNYRKNFLKLIFKFGNL